MFLPVVQKHYFSHKLIVISHFDEVIPHNLALDLLILIDYVVAFLHLMNFQDIWPRKIDDSIFQEINRFILTCEFGRYFNELFIFIIIVVGWTFGRLVLCIRWRWTSSSAWGSVHRWSEVFTRVNSSAHGPAIKKNIKIIFFVLIFT